MNFTQLAAQMAQAQAAQGQVPTTTVSAPVAMLNGRLLMHIFTLPNVVFYSFCRNKIEVLKADYLQLGRLRYLREN